MSEISLTQWILFFFIYCFFGWIWESLFVSAQYVWKNKKLKFINRGFLHGPVIPIYGFAAVSILAATFSVRDNTVAVYLTGALTATLFELVTGTVMERLFKVKYWDYSNLPLNYRGHICFFVSLFWGCFAVLLVQVIHVPIEGVLKKIPEIIRDGAAFLLIALFAYDTSQSFNEAMDLRELMESLAENNESLRRLENRINAVAAFSQPIELEELKEEIKRNAKEAVLYNVERRRNQRRERLERLKAHLQLPDFAELPDRAEILEQIEQQMRQLFAHRNKQFLRAASQLRRNPMLNSEKHRETLDALKQLLKNR